jgi:hypothetical protein
MSGPAILPSAAKSINPLANRPRANAGGFGHGLRRRPRGVSRAFLCTGEAAEYFVEYKIAELRRVAREAGVATQIVSVEELLPFLYSTALQSHTANAHNIRPSRTIARSVRPLSTGLIRERGDLPSAQNGQHAIRCPHNR